jgi:hypothetical protein
VTVRPKSLAIALVAALFALAGCGGDSTTTTSTPASASASVQQDARDLVIKYLSADSAAEVHELCQTAFTDFYLRSQVGACDDSGRFAAQSVDLAEPEFHLHEEGGAQVGSAVFEATIHGGPYDGRTLRIVLDNDGTGWLIDESSEER